MFRFGACCSKLLFLAIAISLLGNCVGGDDAVPSASSGAFKNDNHLLLDGSLDYTVDNQGIITLTLKKYTLSAEVKLVVPKQDAITFIAIRPKLCLDKKPIGFCYADGCKKSLWWEEENTINSEQGVSAAGLKYNFSIQNGETTMDVPGEDGFLVKGQVKLCPTNFKKNDESSQGGYLATFKLFGQYGCDFSVQFPPGYKIFVPPTIQTTAAPSKALEWWDIVAICAAVVVYVLQAIILVLKIFDFAVSLVLVGIAVWCIYKYHELLLPTTSETKPSAPTAVTCLPAQKVIKTSATTQVAPVSGDVKQGIVPAPTSSAPTPSAPPPSAPPSSAPPQESDDERFQRRKRERIAMFKAATIEVPPVPAPILETASHRLPSAEFRRTLESRDETELAPNTVKLERYERERSHRKRYERQK